MTKPDIKVKITTSAGQSDQLMVSMLVNSLTNLRLLWTKTRPPNQQPGRVTSTYRTGWKHTPRFRVCGLWQSKYIRSSNLDSASRIFFKFKDFNKKRFPMSCGGLPRYRNAKLQSLLACHAWQIACCLGSSWNAKICAKNGLWHLSMWKKMYYKYTFSNYLNVYQTQLYVWMYFVKHNKVQVYYTKTYRQTAIQPHRHTYVNMKNNIDMK